MALYAIGDLHLSFSVNKPMDIFGDIWQDYENKIKQNWLELVKEEDVVLIPGDISWASKLEEAKVDLEWIDQLPGKKMMIRGNHDYWWGTLAKMNPLFESISFIQNNYLTYKDTAICGTRGWLSPNEIKFDDKDQKIYKRELGRLRLSLESAKKDGYEDIVVMIHFPPTNDKWETSGFTQLFEEFKVRKVVYGHLHTVESFKVGLQGIYNGTEYVLTSCDYLEFVPKKVLD